MIYFKITIKFAQHKKNIQYVVRSLILRKKICSCSPAKSSCAHSRLCLCNIKKLIVHVLWIGINISIYLLVWDSYSEESANGPSRAVVPERLKMYAYSKNSALLSLWIETSTRTLNKWDSLNDIMYSNTYLHHQASEISFCMILFHFLRAMRF